MRARRPAPVVVLCLLVAALAGCGDDGAEAALARLDTSRDEVRALAVDLRARVVGALEGDVAQQSGGWESCVSASNEVGTEFRYSARVLMTTVPAGRRLLGPAAQLVSDAGLQRTTGATDEVRAVRGDLEAVLWAVPGTEGVGYAEGDLLVSVAGPCLAPPDSAVGEYADRVGPDDALE